MSLLDLAIKASDIKPADVHAGILLYGDPGSGKTHAAVKGGKPFVLLLERNGLTTIKRANPDAMVVVVESLDQIREAIQLALSGQLQAAGYDRLVIDSLTELQRYFKDEIAAARDGGGTTDSFSQQEWGVLTEKMRRFLRTLRSIPMSVICTALSQGLEANINGNNVVSFRPAFEGKKTAAETAQYFNGIGFTVKYEFNGNGEHRVMFDGPSRYVTKSCGKVVSGLVNVEEHGAPEWLIAISDPDADVIPEKAPAEKAPEKGKAKA